MVKVGRPLGLNLGGFIKRLDAAGVTPDLMASKARDFLDGNVTEDQWRVWSMLMKDVFVPYMNGGVGGRGRFISSSGVSGPSLADPDVSAAIDIRNFMDGEGEEESSE